MPSLMIYDVHNLRIDLILILSQQIKQFFF